jgi:hypothetical protein
LLIFIFPKKQAHNQIFHCLLCNTKKFTRKHLVEEKCLLIFSTSPDLSKKYNIFAEKT